MTNPIQKETLVEGVRVGLKAFIMAYVMAFVMSLVINLSIIDQIQDYLQGTLSEGIGFNFGAVVKVTSIILNASVFNHSGTIQLGLLAFGVLPLIAFFVANRNDNKTEGMDVVGFVIYGLASFTFTALLMAVAYLTRGNLLSMDIDFVSWRNAFMTFIITFLIQLTIGMNYNTHRLPGIIATRWMVRMSLVTTTLVSVIVLVSLMLPYTKNIALILLALLVLVPNLSVYTFFMMFGLSVEFNDSLQKLLAFVEVELSYGALPIGLRLVLIFAFFLFALFAISRIDRSRYGQGLIGFAITFPLLSYLLASCTIIDLGVVKGMMDVRLGINLYHAWLYPFVGIIAIGISYMLINKLFHLLRE